MNKKPEIAETTILYHQDNDSCDSEELGQDIKVFSQDAGAGKYVCIETKRWSIDPDEIDHFVEMLKAVLKD